MTFTRTDNRNADELRAVKITPNFVAHAEGSALIEMGNTRVICAASVEDKLPFHLRSQRVEGWVTAEYAMLPRSTHTRTQRELGRGGPSGRTHEIQRLIGRSMRAIVNRKLLGERTITLDCDVLQADGGTRTAAITGASLAVSVACGRLVSEGKISESPIKKLVAAVSVGMIDGVALLDLNYEEDKAATVDLNLVATEDGSLVEVQGAGEEATFSHEELLEMLSLGRKGIVDLIAAQRSVLAQTAVVPG